MDFNRYFTNDELAAQLNEWATTYPNILTLGVLGQSYEGKDIPLLTLTNKATGADTDKPAVWLDANIHATEIAGTTTTLRIVWELLSKYGSDEKVTRLVDTSTFYVVPRLNPDGAGDGRPAKIRPLRRAPVSLRKWTACTPRTLTATGEFSRCGFPIRTANGKSAPLTPV